MRPQTLLAFFILLTLCPILRAEDSTKAFDLAPTSPVAPAPTTKPVDPDSLLPTDSNYIVHEWGTFTSFSGSDGISLDFRTLVTSDLPAFVIDRQKQSFLCERRERAYTLGLLTKGGVLSRQRMETPVTYFYTDKERIVDVVVEFPHGLLTEFYPPVRQFGPAFKKNQPESLEASWLRWGKVRLLPPSQAMNKAGIDPLIPPVKPGEGEHYAFARETDSAHIQLTDPAMSTTYREKFLFYRGVGNFDLPVSVKASGSGQFVLSGPCKVPLGFAFIVQSDAGQIRFARYDNASNSTTMTLPAEVSSLDSLGDEMVKALVKEGLYDKEAIAMVKTWKSSWFGEPGTRVLFSLPQAYTDQMLPLKLQPAPKTALRVMVGRLEILTPEKERIIEKLIGQLGSADPAIREQASTIITQLGRFAEPALTRISQITDDPETSAKAKALLRQILLGKPVTPADDSDLANKQPTAASAK